MNEWEELGMTEDEYREAMEAMPDEPMSEADVCAFYIESEHASSFENPCDMWSHAYDLTVAAQVCRESGESALQRYVTSAADQVAAITGDMPALVRMDFQGGHFERMLSTIDAHGRLAALDAGRDWDAIVSRSEGVEAEVNDGLDDLRDPPVERFEDLPFDRLLDWRVEHLEPWTRADAELMNAKICEEFDAIEQRAYEDSVTHDAMVAEAEDIDRVREQDGIRGDEPDIPWYVARDHAFGKSYDELMAEADAFGDEVGRTYEQDMQDLFERVYDMASRDWNGLPSEVTAGIKDTHYSISQDTYRHLGEGYWDFYRDRVENYRLGRMLEYETQSRIAEVAASPGATRPANGRTAPSGGSETGHSSGATSAFGIDLHKPAAPTTGDMAAEMKHKQTVAEVQAPVPAVETKASSRRPSTKQHALLDEAAALDQMRDHGDIADDD